MSNETLNAIAHRNRRHLVTGLLFGATLAVTYITSALYLPL